MGRLFEIEELRTLAARALAGGDYKPAESARVRAVPDTRTIRYYTTLGLLNPPAKMRGRTALYNETHVLQIVAIKRLQAEDLSLSDIQKRLVGLTNSRLTKIAKLSADFWPAADKYLQKRQREPAGNKSAPKVSHSDTDSPPIAKTPAEPLPAWPSGLVSSEASCDTAEEFWLTPAALPMSVVEPALRAIIELQLAGGVRVSIQFPAHSSPDSTIDWSALNAAAQPLLKELRRQNIVRP